MNSTEPKGILIGSTLFGDLTQPSQLTFGASVLSALQSEEKNLKVIQGSSFPVTSNAGGFLNLEPALSMPRGVDIKSLTRHRKEPDSDEEDFIRKSDNSTSVKDMVFKDRVHKLTIPEIKEKQLADEKNNGEPSMTDNAKFWE